jgi:hypothetical protein
MPPARVARRCLLALALALAALTAAAGSASSSSGSVPPAGVVRARPAGEIRGAGHGRAKPGPHGVRYAHPKRLLRAKRAAFRRYQRALRHSRGRPAAGRLRFKGNIFAGLNAQGFAFGSGADPKYVSPSDSTGAVGPSNYVEFTNGGIVVYDISKLSLTSVATSSLDNFVGLPAGTTTSGDPQIQWDPVSQRWYYLAYTSNLDNSKNFIMWGWSKSASPTGLGSSGWCKFSLDTGAVFPDFTKLGHDDTHLIFGANGFKGIDPITALIYVFSKPANGDMTCPAAPAGTQFGSATQPLATWHGVAADSPVPANAVDSQANGYVVSADAPNGLMIWHVKSGPSGAELVPDGEPTVPSFSAPANAPQPGTPNVIDTLDGRLTQAVARADPTAGGNEALWTQHTVNGSGGRAVVRWYELLPASSAIRQRGALGDASNFLFNAAISPASDGASAAIVYNASGPGLRPAIRASVRRAAAPLGTVGFPLAIASSGSSFNDFSCDPPTPKDPPICRWGDFSGATPDPGTQNVVWASQQYSGGGRWLTRNFAVQIAATGPTAVLSAAPNPVTAGNPVTFDGSASTDSATTIARYTWDLDGNGTFETDTGGTPKVTHVYHAAGTRLIRLRVVDLNGDLSDAAVGLTVKAPVIPPPSPQCKAAIKKRKQLQADVKRLKQRLKKAKDPKKRNALSKQLSDKRTRLKRAKAAESKACKP